MGRNIAAKTSEAPCWAAKIRWQYVHSTQVESTLGLRGPAGVQLPPVRHETRGWCVGSGAGLVTLPPDCRDLHPTMRTCRHAGWFLPNPATSQQRNTRTTNMHNTSNQLDTSLTERFARALHAGGDAIHPGVGPTFPHQPAHPHSHPHPHPHPHPHLKLRVFVT